MPKSKGRAKSVSRIIGPYALQGNAATLKAKQLGVRTCGDRKQNQFRLFDLIHKQPIRRKVAFPIPLILACERVIPVFRRKGLFIGQ